MGELFTVIGEIVMWLVEAFATWAQALFEGFIVLACFLFSRSFRAKRLELWRLQPSKKYLDLGLASFWFALVIALPCYLFLPFSNDPADGEPVEITLTTAKTNEDLRVELRTMRTNDHQTIGTVGVKKGGAAKILGTKSLQELKTQLVENVSFIPTSTTNINSTTNK